jgi:hypothetical protein
MAESVGTLHEHMLSMPVLLCHPQEEVFVLHDCTQWSRGTKQAGHY